MARYSKGLKCPFCKGKMSDKARMCQSCYLKSVKKEEPPAGPLFAWRYDCQICGIKAFSFDPHKSVGLTCGHEVKRGERFLYSKP